MSLKYYEASRIICFGPPYNFFNVPGVFQNQLTAAAAFQHGKNQLTTAAVFQHDFHAPEPVRLLPDKYPLGRAGFLTVFSITDVFSTSPASQPSYTHWYIMHIAVALSSRTRSPARRR